ncbi:MAG: hypothetical protein JJE13_11545 [Thermoleophilia bacterium]|nr:hypothetical protein [Thermoleophilia bacterium]
MTISAKYLKLSFALVAAAAVALMLLMGGGIRQADAAKAKCPSFHVLHNDKIGALSLPAGYYKITLLDPAKLSCASASKLFAEFLQDYDGKLRKPWVLDAASATFSQGAGSTVGFKVSKTGSGGAVGASTPASCPGYFTVVHNDSIGSFKIPAGKYRLTLVDSAQRLTCKKAALNFSEFLQDYDGKLPFPWKLKKSSATFYKSTNPKLGFNINRAYSEPVSTVGGTYSRCPGTFKVRHNDRIGKLLLPKGPYYITVGNGKPLSCSAAANYFRQFLNYPDGKLPAPWKLNATKARFRSGPGGYVFRVQQA